MTPRPPDAAVTDHRDVAAGAPRPDPAPEPSSATPAPIVDFSRAARRVRRSAGVLGTLALVGWVVVGLVTGGPDPADLGAWVGLALLGMFVVEVVVVGGSAARGMLNAGDRGQRLAGGDVGLLPPQLSRTRRRSDDDTVS